MEWPKEENVPVTFTDLVTPVRDAVKQVYRIRRIDKNKGVQWKGPPLPKSIYGALDFEDQVSAEGLRYNNDEQGRDPMYVILGVAVQLGIEQGRRMVLSELVEEGKQNAIDKLIDSLVKKSMEKRKKDSEDRERERVKSVEQALYIFAEHHPKKKNQRGELKKAWNAVERLQRRDELFEKLRKKGK